MERVGSRGGSDLHAQKLSPPGYRKLKRRLSFRQPLRPERYLAVVVAQAAEAVGQNHPCTAHRGNMASVSDVSANVSKIHQQSCTRILHSLIVFPDLQRNDRLDTG